MNTTRYQAFTPGTAGDMEGALVFFRMAAGTTDQTVTVTLQKNDGGWADVADANLTRTFGSLYGVHATSYGSGWYYFKFTTPAAVTAVADTWRLKISATSNGAEWCKNTTYFYAAVLTTATTYTSGDNIFFDEDSEITIDQSITAAHMCPALNTHFTWENPPVAAYTLTITTLWGFQDLYFRVGTSDSRIPLAQKATITIALILYQPYSATCQEWFFYGEKPTNVYTTFAADANNGQKVITTTNDMSAYWTPGDTIFLMGQDHASAYPESKVIDTIVGTTVTFTANLTYKHFSGWAAINWKASSCGIQLAVTASTIKALAFEMSGVYLAGGSISQYTIGTPDLTRIKPRVIDMVFNLNNTFSFSGDLNGYTQTNGSSLTDFYRWGSSYMGPCAFRYWNNATFTRVIGSTGGSGNFSFTSVSSTFTDIQTCGGASNGMTSFYISGCTLTRVKGLGTAYPVLLAGHANTFVDSTFDKGSSYGVYLDTSVGNVFDNCEFGSDSANGADFGFVPGGIYVQAVCKDCSSVTVHSGITTTNMKSFIKAHAFDDTANDHRSWYPYGSIVSTGDGLTDTTVHTAGTGKFAIRFEPLSSTNSLTWDISIPTGNIQSKTMFVGVWVKIASATYYAGTHQLPRLTIDYDDGTTSYAQAAESTDWQLLIVSFTPTTTYGQITATLSARTDATTTDAYVYWDDFSVAYPPNVSLDLGGMDLWADALPIVPPLAIPISAVTVASAVWEELTSSHTTASTMGKKLGTTLKNSALIIDGEITV